MDNIINNTVEECVRQYAAAMPEKAALVCNETTLSYSQLWLSVCQTKRDLIANGLKEGALNIFRASQNADFITTYLATHLIGAVAVPLEKDCPEGKFNEIAGKFGNTVLPQSGRQGEGIADILFTTGSTGQQKGVMESYRAIMADADNLIHAQGFTNDTAFIISGPLNHIGSLSKLWAVFASGGTLIIAEGMKDIDGLFRLFDYPGTSIATFMVPASIRMMLQFGEKRLSGLSDKIDFIETGGAAISQSDMDALCQALPNTRLYNTYASTETGIISTYDYNHNPRIAGCTGKPMRNSSARITADGTIACSGLTLMSGYIGDDDLTRSVLHDGTMFTNDIGEIDSEGNLYIKGRDNDVMNVGGYKVSPQEVENAAMSFPTIADCICFMTTSDLFGDTTKLLYVPKQGGHVSKRELALYLASRMERYKVPRIIEPTDSIRHTYNGKPDRKYYK